MGNFVSELIGSIVEICLELCGKTKPDTIPDIEYKKEFVVKYTGVRIFIKSLVSIMLIIISAVCFAVTYGDKETGPIFLIFSVLGIVTLLPAVYAMLYKCIIDEENLICCKNFKRKKYEWRCILCIRKIATKNQHALTIALYDKSGKCIFDCDTDMENAWCIIKMADKKGIEIREEKDLSIKQINHL